MMPYTRPVCRGDWILGTACGHCERCEETRPRPTPAPDDVETRALALLDKHSNYMGGIGRGQRSLPVSCALRAVMEALSPPSAGISFPTNEDEAAAMALLGTNWLQEHAPHRLKQSNRSAVLEEAAACAEGHVGKAKRDRIARGWKMSRYQPHERDEIAAEENGIDIAAEIIADAIRKLKERP